MIGAAAIAKLDKLEIIMDTILVDVVEIGEHPVSPLKRLTRGYPSVFLHHKLHMLVGIPRHEVAQVDATHSHNIEFLVGRILCPEKILCPQSFLPLGMPELL